MTLELRWGGKYDDDGVRVRAPSCPVALRPWAVFPGTDPAQLIEGENLGILDALLERQRETIDLIYLDPPFATGGQFAWQAKIGEGAQAFEVERFAYDDRFDGGVEGLVRMLDPRLARLYELLAPHGSLYVHVDPVASHAVKLLLDEVFGPECFQREIIWRIGWVSGFKTRARNWIRNHDVILYYTKDPKTFTFNKRYTPYPAGYRRRDGALPRGQGVPVDDVWNANPAEFGLRGRDSLDSIQIKSFSPEKSGYATQKNESLLRRIVEASSNPGDSVFDPFCGSGSTAVAAVELGRRFIGCDQNPAAVHIAAKRLRSACPDAGLRIERASVSRSDTGAETASIPAPSVEVQSVAPPGEARVWRIRLVAFDEGNLGAWPSEILDRISDRFDLLDAWWVAFDQGTTPHVVFHAFRTSRERTLAREATVVLPEGATHVRIGFVDVLGRTVDITRTAAWAESSEPGSASDPT